MYGLELLLPFSCVLCCTGGGMMVRARQAKRVRILTALYDCTEEILFLLQSGMYDTGSILSACMKTEAGETLTCLSNTLARMEQGEDLYDAWEREAQIFCGQNAMEPKTVPVMRQMIRLLGSMDYTGQCSGYQLLLGRLGKLKEDAVKRQQTDGMTAVKIGLLSGIGLGLLLWNP